MSSSVWRSSIAFVGRADVTDAALASPTAIDWTESLERDFRRRFIEAIKALDIRSLERYPPPKTNGLPFGHEMRILRRFVRGGSSMLDQSALSGAYRALASPRQRLTYRALVIGESLPTQAWHGLIGSAAVSDWMAAHVLEATPGGRIRARFRTIAASNLILIVDPLDETFRFRVHIGQDSLNMAEFLTRRDFPRDIRTLDVGTGSGILLMTVARGAREGVGVDINPRAVRIASFNAELNELSNCRIELRDIFAHGGDLGRFECITWNTPFMFFPESWREKSVDGYGGHLGIEIPLKFVDQLPSLLSDRGTAFLLAAGPRMLDGSNRLDFELDRRARAHRLDVVAHVLQTFWFPSLREFYAQHRVQNFESVMLEISRGHGRVIRRDRSLAITAVDAVRDLIYRVRGQGLPSR
jgi:methylase of polypeptide subunit release factors